MPRGNVRQKPVAMLAYKRGGRGIAPVVPPSPLTWPDPPEGISALARQRWDGFWQSNVSGLVDLKRDGERLENWIRSVHERERLWALWSRQPLITKTNGEIQGNPLWRAIKDLTGTIERAEQQFGMGPLNKMRLTGALDQAEAAEVSIERRRETRAKPPAMPARRVT